jgi:O-antigen/teichoic acid export membrane protein
MHKNNTIQAFWIGMGSLCTFALSIVSAAILSRYFNKTDYGTYRQIIYVYSTLLVIFAAGLPTVFSYFLPRFTLNKGKYIVRKITKVLFLLGALFSIFLFIFSDLIANTLKNPELSKALKIFSPIPMLLLPTLGIDGIFSTYRKTYFIAIYDILTRIIMLLCIVLPVIFFKGSLLTSIYGWLAASSISFILALFFKGIPFKGIVAENANLSFKEIFTFSLPLVTASIWGIAIKAADQFYISRYFGSEIFAEFSNGFIEIPLVSMVTSATATVMLPVFSKMFYEKSSNKDFVDLWRNTLLKSAIIIYPIVIFFIFHAQSIITILYSTKYLNSIIYSQIAMFINFFNIIIFAPLLFALGKTKFYSNLHLFIAIGSWGFGYITVIVFNSPIALAIMSVSMSILKVIIAFIYTSKFINIKIGKLIPLKKISFYILHSVITLIIIQIIFIELVPKLNELVYLLVSSIFFLTILLGTAVPLKLNYFSVIRPIFEKYKIGVRQNSK